MIYKIHEEMLTCQETTTWAGLLGSTHTEQWQKEKRGDRN